MFYVITAQYKHTRKDRDGSTWDASIQVPTFYLNADVQGITDAAHAERIARSVISPADPDYPGLIITAAEVN